MKAPLTHQAINGLVVIITTSLKALPRSIRQRVVHGLAWLIFSFSEKTKNRAITNIRRALPELSLQGATKMAVTSYKNIVFGLFETFWLHKVNFNYDIDEQSQNLLLSGQALSIATMHMSNFEAVPFALQRLTGRSVTLSNIPSFLISAHKLYQRLGITCFNKKDKSSFLQLLRAIKRNQVISLHSDHYGKDVDVCFFKQKTKAPHGAAMLSAYGNAPLLIAYTVMEASGNYKFVVRTISSVGIDNHRSAIAEATQAIYLHFERAILDYPEQWYWSYNRWR